MNLPVNFSRTKIVATLGPASTPKEVLKKMFITGVDICRLNFSHSKYEEHLKAIQTIRELNEELGTNVAILADLQGPKLRIGEVENNLISLKEGEILTFVCSEPFMGNKEKVYMSYKEFPMDVTVGETILIDDGKYRFQVIESNKKDMVKAKALNDANLSSKKGVNLPDTKVSLPSLTEKDIKDAEFALDHDVDWIALSFVRTVTDIMDLKNIIKKRKKNTGIIAKIEKPEAIIEIDEIIDATNAIMVARGDLGVEIPFQKVPLIQKELIQKCIKQGRPVIVATQMMESMITSFSPTRAETNDVANAVLDGADAVMLSGETSVGKYPVRVIECMQNVIDWTEKNGYCFYRNNAPIDLTQTFFSDSICYTATQMAKQVKAKAIVCFTHSGHSALRLSSHRPEATIFAFTSNKSLLGKLSLFWGVRDLYFGEYKNIEEAIENSVRILKEKGYVVEGDILVHLASIPQNLKGRANMVRLTNVL